MAWIRCSGSRVEWARFRVGVSAMPKMFFMQAEILVSTWVFILATLTTAGVRRNFSATWAWSRATPPGGDTEVNPSSERISSPHPTLSARARRPVRSKRASRWWAYKKPGESATTISLVGWSRRRLSTTPRRISGWVVAASSGARGAKRLALSNTEEGRGGHPPARSTAC